MKLLALDTATDVIALGLCHGPQAYTRNHPGGGAASSHLIPQALALLAEAGMGLAELDAIAFGAGPGAFTGLRTAVSVAQGLAFGVNKPVLALDSLAIVAEDARAQALAAGAGWPAHTLCWVAMDARMDEAYAAAYRFDGDRWVTVVAPALYALPTLVATWARLPPEVLAGNASTAFGDRLPSGSAVQLPQVLDRAGAMLRLARAAYAAGHTLPPDQALPVYLRDKVALTTAEREAAKAAVALASVVAPSGGDA